MEEDFDFEDFIELQKYYLDMIWQRLSEEGFIWQDRFGKMYRTEEISDRYLLNILKFCEKSWRPEEQIDALKKLAEQRNLRKAYT